MDLTFFEDIDVAGIHVNPAAAAVGLLVALAGFLAASRLAARVRGARAGAEDGARWRATLATMTGHLVRLVGVVLGLQLAGIDLGSVLAASAVAAVGIGIAMQKVAENFVSGVILMAERSIREGDIIEHDGAIAKVRHIGIRATIARTLDEEEIIVPNSLLAQSPVKNLTLLEPTYRLRVRVGVSYSTDLAQAEAALYDAAASVATRDASRAPVVLLVDFGASSVDFEVSIWTQDVWGMRRGQSELRKAIWAALRRASVDIPFPQLDVHFDAPSRGERLSP